MSPEWISILAQVPFLGAFIWYSLEMAKRSSDSHKAFMDALSKRDESFEIRNSAVIHTIDNLNAAICTQLRELSNNHEEHDRFVREKLPARTRTKTG